MEQETHYSALLEIANEFRFIEHENPSSLEVYGLEGQMLLRFMVADDPGMTVDDQND